MFYAAFIDPILKADIGPSFQRVKCFVYLLIWNILTLVPAAFLFDLGVF